MLTKSLHTVTAVTNVALHLRASSVFTDATALTRAALAVLGYDVRAFDTTDTTIQACIKSVRKATGHA